MVLSRSATGAHIQVRVKVAAWVDEAIAPLIEALNELPDVWTTESCQGSDTGFAAIYFVAGPEGSAGKPARTLTVAVWLGERLGEKETACYEDLSIIWSPGHPEPVVLLRVAKSSVPALTQVIRELVEEARTEASELGVSGGGG